MTSRERARRALEHRQPDRVPIDIGGTHDTTFLEESLRRVQRLLGTSGPGRPANRWLGSVFPDQETMERLGSDFRPVALPAPDYPVETLPDGTSRFTDEWSITWTRRPGSLYHDVLEFHRVESVRDTERPPWPEPDTGSDAWKLTLEELRRDARGLEKVLEVYLAQAEGVLQAAGLLVDAVYGLADDLGTQGSLWLSPGQYRSVVKPYHRRVVEFIKKRTAAKVIFHSCGAVQRFIPDLIEIGVDALNPVQVSARGMDLPRLKREYGRDLVFWGGIDTQRVLPRGTPEEVREEVRRRVDVLCREGGYVLSAVHNIQPDVPPQNVLAMAEEAGRYRPAG